MSGVLYEVGFDQGISGSCSLNAPRGTAIRKRSDWLLDGTPMVAVVS